MNVLKANLKEKKSKKLFMTLLLKISVKKHFGKKVNFIVDSKEKIENFKLEKISFSHSEIPSLRENKNSR